MSKILSLDELKTFLNINDDLSDDKLQLILDSCEDFVFEFTNNEFIADELFGLNVEFVEPNILKFTGDDYDYFDKKIKENMYIKLNGSRFNDGVYKVVSKNGNEYTVDSDIIQEDSIFTYLVYLKFPSAIKKVLIDMVNYDFTTERKGVEYEKLGDYAISYESKMGYPNEILSVLKKYKMVKFI